ncbi:MAG: glycoside hydrolase N-terminal domain-containing protein, partial [Paludibacteraceae bacterium]
MMQNLKNVIVFVIVTILTNLSLLATDNKPLNLWYNQPAKVWGQAIPVGNGRLGAMIYGGVET